MESKDFIGFYGTRGAYGVFSNFWPVSFEVGGVIYSCSEQFLMHQKALLFGDAVSADTIMAATDPREMKKLGRRVTPFDPNVWEERCEKLVLPGLFAKFYQNPECGRILLETKDKVIAECAPRDTIWGIGMGVTNPDRLDPQKWRGRNRLGNLLMRVRAQLQETIHDTVKWE